jgi:mRNA-degrading endonuclease toxin of MazEF toxin-antitoxin module
VTYSRWDVVAVVFPFLEGDQAKHRPALIISTDRLHDKHELYWVVMITTAKAGLREDDISIADPELAGLPDSCVIRVSRLTTLSDRQIVRRLGSIQPKQRNAVQALLRKYAP